MVGAGGGVDDGEDRGAVAQQSDGDGAASLALQEGAGAVMRVDHPAVAVGQRIFVDASSTPASSPTNRAGDQGEQPVAQHQLDLVVQRGGHVVAEPRTVGAGELRRDQVGRPRSPRRSREAGWRRECRGSGGTDLLSTGVSCVGPARRINLAAPAGTRYPTAPPWIRTSYPTPSPVPPSRSTARLACHGRRRANWRPIRRRNTRRRRLQTLWEALRGYDPAPSPAAGSSLLGRLLRRKAADTGGAGGNPAGALPRRRGRARQVHADGSVLRQRRGGAQTTHPFPSLHADLACPGVCLEAGQPGRHRSDPAAGRHHRARRRVAVLRRVPGQRHRRRHDPWPVVSGAVRARRGGRRHLQRRARRFVQGPAGPRCVPAVHRADQATARCRDDGRGPRFPARADARDAHLVCAGRRIFPPRAG